MNNNRVSINNISNLIKDIKKKNSKNNFKKNRILRNYLGGVYTNSDNKYKMQMAMTPLINNMITMDLTPFIDTYSNYDNLHIDIKSLHVKNIKKIYNIYQPKYKYNCDEKIMNVTGFGDFIRGCYFLLDFCETYNFELKIVMNHPVSKYFKPYNSMFDSEFDALHVQTKKLIFSNVSLFTKNNCHHHSVDSNKNITNIADNMEVEEFVNYLRDDVPVYKNSIFIYNIMYPNNIVSQKHKYFMQRFLEPVDEIKNYVFHVLQILKLSKKNYHVIQIRSGDNYLNDYKSEIYINYIDKLVSEIIKVIHIIKKNSLGLSSDLSLENGLDLNILLVSDNLNIKYLLLKKLPFLKNVLKNVTHFGEGVVQEDDKIKNTLLDFYLMSFSSSINAFSCYNHGSGFSEWCASTYNIPYVCKLINV